MSKLMQYLPNYYRTSKVMTNITDVYDIELQEFQTKLDNTLNQFFVDLADTSLDRWEKELGIPVNSSKPDEYRRSVIKSKLRGQGTITINFIKNVAESYSNGEVEVTENNSNYSFTITFVGTKGIPPNMDDLKNAIEDIKPAHLGFTFEYTYNTYQYLSQFTHADLALYTHTDLREVI
ncbi:YmfQ family protein [Caminicella sporogenes]|uniref:YmfQ family protein n=1 Tax=Caminicella sporogenes TaxID=166485 RepID=UPI00253FC16C|nr:YmfQ family protein [Caminicella sporogenes]WIF95113.1 YmfQ family protein [Caminicella sporogenes]